MHARGHKEGHNRPGGGLVTGKLGEFGFSLLKDGYYHDQIALKSIRLKQFLPLGLHLV